MTVDELRDLIVARGDDAKDSVGTLTATTYEAHRFALSNGPETVVRNCDEDLAVLDRHTDPEPTWSSNTYCTWCDYLWPCPDVESIARRYGKELT